MSWRKPGRWTKKHWFEEISIVDIRYAHREIIHKRIDIGEHFTQEIL